MVPRPPFNRLSAITENFNSRGLTFLREGCLQHGWLPLLLAPVLGVALALLIVAGSWGIAIPVVLLVPAVILLVRYPFAVIMVYMLVFPFFSTRIDRYAYYALHGAMIPVILGYVLLSQWLGIRRKEPVRFGPPELAMALFLGLAVGSILLAGSNPRESLEQFYDRLFVPFCVYWLVRLLAPRERDFKRLLWVGAFVVIVQIAIGFLAWKAPGILPGSWLDRVGARTTGTLGSPAAYSTTLMFFSLLLFQQAMQSNSIKLRAVLLSVFALGLYGVFITYSRGSWLAAAVVLLGLVLLYPKVTIRIGGLIVALAFILGNTLLADEVAFATRRLNAEDTASGRVVLVNTGLKMIAAKPLFGWGYDSYDRYDDRFQERVGDIPVAADNTSHNTYVTMAAELGLPGLFLYLFPVAYWLVLSIKAWRRLPQRGFWSRRLLSILWLVIMAHIVVSSFMDMVRFRPFGTTMWWLTLGLIATIVYPLRKPLGSGDPGWNQQATGHARGAE